MSKRKRNGKGNRPEPDPKTLGAQWRAQMTDECESLPALVWKRVFATRQIDLSDPRQADDVQVWELLSELMSTRDTSNVEVQVWELEAFVDTRVDDVFRMR
jgi:hypothetical protein